MSMHVPLRVGIRIPEGTPTRPLSASELARLRIAPPTLRFSAAARAPAAPKPSAPPSPSSPPRHNSAVPYDVRPGEVILVPDADGSLDPALAWLSDPDAMRRAERSATLGGARIARGGPAVRVLEADPGGDYYVDPDDEAALLPPEKKIEVHRRSALGILDELATVGALPEDHERIRRRLEVGRDGRAVYATLRSLGRALKRAERGGEPKKRRATPERIDEVNRRWGGGAPP